MTGQVIVTDSEVFQSMQNMFQGVCEMNLKLMNELRKKSFELWTAKEVAEYTKLSYKAILAKKEQIGWIAIGDDVRFDPDTVKAYFLKKTIAPAKSKY